MSAQLAPGIMHQLVQGVPVRTHLLGDHLQRHTAQGNGIQRLVLAFSQRFAQGRATKASEV